MSDPVFTARETLSDTVSHSIPVIVDKRFFAACAAMQGMLSCQDFMNEVSGQVSSKEQARAVVAYYAARQADALLRELDSWKGPPDA